MNHAKTFAAITLIALSTASHAESWGGYDKRWHFYGGMGLAAAVTAATGDETKGWVAGTAAGVLKEVYDIKHGHVSAKDLIVTSLGAYIGAKGTGWVIAPDRVAYRWTFNIF